MNRNKIQCNGILKWWCRGAYLLALFAIPFINIDVAFSAETARLYSLEGSVEGRFPPESKWQPVVSNAVFHDGDSIRTGDSSRAAIVGADGMMVRLGANSLLEFKPTGKGESKEISVGSGDAYFLSRDPHNAPKITTTIVSGSIRGTEFAVSVKPDLVTFSVLNGEVECGNKLGSVDLTAGEEALTQPGQAPQKRLMIRPYDAVQWSLRYPGVISISSFIPWLRQGSLQDQNAADLLEQGKYSEARVLFKNNSAKSILGPVLIALAENDKLQASKILSKIKDIDDPSLALLKAGLTIEAGQVENANALQAKVSSLLVGNSSEAAKALRQVLKSQQAIVEVVRDNREKAELLVSAELKANPKNIEVLFAKSVLLQAKGDVNAALDLIEESLKLEPNNSYLLARAAELTFGTGDTKHAEELARLALRQNPNDTDAKTILGFILLSYGKVDEGRGIFEQAIAEGGSSSAHLGLGIAKFRDGESEQARTEIQKAVHLDPKVALYRSYLGKAFFENERESLAASELSIAMQLDPLDPTPHLYAAFNNLASFQPIAALESLEDSIALNDNRAVYRSRFLLDRDQATRGTGLGRIFGALDFNQLARIEALKSLSEDPTNYSAHFLLKDSLIGPETNSASISEDVVATLLAPATFSSLLSTASGSSTLNDYTSLFEQSQARNEVDFIIQSFNRAIETSEVHFAGGDDYSYLLRHGMTYANGYRDNDYDRAQTARFLGQYDVTPENKILLEGIVSGRDQGDTLVGLEPDKNDPDQSFEFDDFTSRLGFHHTFSEQSHLISQTLFVNSRFQTRDLSQQRNFLLSVEQTEDSPQEALDSGLFDSHSSVRTKGVRADLQHLWTSQYLSLVNGAALLGFRESQDSFGATSADDLGIFESLEVASEANNQVRAYRGYSYGTLKPDKDLRIVAGLNYSDLSSSPTQIDPFVYGETNQSELSPKAGLIFYPSSALTLRAAYFETLGQVSARDFEGIEPVQVAGIQQVFDDAVGTEARNLGFGTDWKLPKSTYTGVSFTTRSLNAPQTISSDLVSVDLDNQINGSVIQEDFDAHSQENVAAGYINQILTDTLTATFNYDWTQSDDDFYSYQIQTQRARLGLNYFDPSGFFAFGSGTWRSQTRDNFESLDTSVDTDFTILSAGIGWQLPHRHGSLQLAVRNILNEDFNYQPISSDVNFYPGVDVSLGISLNF